MEEVASNSASLLEWERSHRVAAQAQAAELREEVSRLRRAAAAAEAEKEERDLWVASSARALADREETLVRLRAALARAEVARPPPAAQEIAALRDDLVSLRTACNECRVEAQTHSESAKSWLTTQARELQAVLGRVALDAATEKSMRAKLCAQHLADNLDWEASRERLEAAAAQDRTRAEAAEAAMAETAEALAQAKAQHAETRAELRKGKSERYRLQELCEKRLRELEAERVERAERDQAAPIGMRTEAESGKLARLRAELDGERARVRAAQASAEQLTDELRSACNEIGSLRAELDAASERLPVDDRRNDRMEMRSKDLRALVDAGREYALHGLNPRTDFRIAQTRTRLIMCLIPTGDSLYVSGGQGIGTFLQALAKVEVAAEATERAVASESRPQRLPPATRRTCATDATSPKADATRCTHPLPSLGSGANCDSDLGHRAGRAAGLLPRSNARMARSAPLAVSAPNRPTKCCGAGGPAGCGGALSRPSLHKQRTAVRARLALELPTAPSTPTPWGDHG